MIETTVERKVFRPRLIPTLVALAAVALTGSLGVWQARRYGEQTALVELYHRQHDVRTPVTSLTESAAAADRLEQLHFRRATLTGKLDMAHVQLLTGRYVFGKLGYVVVVPLDLQGGPFPRMLVNLGWAPTEKVPAWLEKLRRDDAQVTLSGRLQVSDARVAGEQPVSEFAGLKTWMHPNTTELAKRIPGLDPDLMLQVGKQANGEQVDPEAVPLDGYTYPVHPLPAKNVEYAMTWFGVALTALAVWAALSRTAGPAPQARRD